MVGARVPGLSSRLGEQCTLVLLHGVRKFLQGWSAHGLSSRECVCSAPCLSCMQGEDATLGQDMFVLSLCVCVCVCA